MRKAKLKVLYKQSIESGRKAIVTNQLPPMSHIYENDIIVIYKKAYKVHRFEYLRDTDTWLFIVYE